MRPDIDMGPVFLVILFLAIFLAVGSASTEGCLPRAVGDILEDADDLWTGMPIHFIAVGSYDVEEGIGFMWDFGDGSEQSTLANPVHVYEEAGTYEVMHTVIDQDGTLSTDTLVLKVNRDYGDTEVVIKALDPTSTRTFRDPDPGLVVEVAVRRGGWVAYLCELRKAYPMEVEVTVIGDRPADVYLFKEVDFQTYRDGPRADWVHSETPGHSLGLTGQFSYQFAAPETGRYYVVIDNREWPEGTDTQGPVDYVISIEPRWDMTHEPDEIWNRFRGAWGAFAGLLVVLVAMVVVHFTMGKGEK